MTSAIGDAGFLSREPLLAMAAKSASLTTREFLLPSVPTAAGECTSLVLAATATATLKGAHLWRPEGTSAATSFESPHLRRCKSRATATLAAASVHRRKCGRSARLAAAVTATLAATHDDARSTAPVAAAFAATKGLGSATTATTTPVITTAGKSGRPTSAVRIASAAVTFARLCCSGTCDREGCDACCEE